MREEREVAGVLWLLVIIVLGCALLGGCAEQVARRDAAIDDIRCNYAPQGSQSYNDCRRSLATGRQQGNLNVNLNH